MTLANYLYSLVYSNTYTIEEWQQWGINLVMDAEFNEETEWVYDIIFCENKTIFFAKLTERMYKENYSYYHSFTLTEIIQGYYYSQFKQNKISLYKMLELSGDVADAADAGCEYFYDLLNKIDANSNIVDSQEFNKEIEEYFEPFCKEALIQKDSLEHCTIADLAIET